MNWDGFFYVVVIATIWLLTTRSAKKAGKSAELSDDKISDELLVLIL